MKIDFKKVIILTIFLLILVLLIIWTAYFCSVKNPLPEKQPEKLSQEYCLTDDEIADYPIDEKSNPSLKIPKEIPLMISVRDKKTNISKFSFEVPDIFQDHYHPVELHKCGVYAFRILNYDSVKTKQKIELWKYLYKGAGEKILDFNNKNQFSYDFRVDSTETYVILERSYLGEEDYALIVKNLKTKEDAFVFSFQEIIDKYPDLVGNMRLDGWSDDGRYFWFDTHIGAMRLGFLRIDTLNWKTDIFEAPGNVMGGDALNFNTGYVTVHPYNKWYGIYEIEQEEKEKMHKEGIGSEIYIESLITKKRHFVDKTDEPLWFFKPKWISDTELEYYLPSEEKKIYEIIES